MLIHREEITVHHTCLCSHFLFCFSHVTALYCRPCTHFSGSLGYDLESSWNHITQMWLPWGTLLQLACHKKQHKPFRSLSLLTPLALLRFHYLKEAHRHTVYTTGCNTWFLELTATTTINSPLRDNANKSENSSGGGDIMIL